MPISTRSKDKKDINRSKSPNKPSSSPKKSKKAAKAVELNNSASSLSTISTISNFSSTVSTVRKTNKKSVPTIVSSTPLVNMSEARVPRIDAALKGKSEKKKEEKTTKATKRKSSSRRASSSGSPAKGRAASKSKSRSPARTKAASKTAGKSYSKKELTAKGKSKSPAKRGSRSDSSDAKLAATPEAPKTTSSGRKSQTPRRYVASTTHRDESHADDHYTLRKRGQTPVRAGPSATQSAASRLASGSRITISKLSESFGFCRRSGSSRRCAAYFNAGYLRFTRCNLCRMALVSVVLLVFLALINYFHLVDVSGHLSTICNYVRAKTHAICDLITGTYKNLFSAKKE